MTREGKDGNEVIIEDQGNKRITEGMTRGGMGETVDRQIKRNNESLRTKQLLSNAEGYIN